MRSLLFVPADDERKLARSRDSGADALILDLEDSVAPEAKGRARKMCADYLRQHRSGPLLFVRVNALSSGMILEDLAAVIGAAPYGIMLPKSTGGDDLRKVSHYLSAFEVRDSVPEGSTRILPIVTELGGALLDMGSYAKHADPRLCGMMWGGEDLAADLGAASNRDAEGRYAPPFQVARSLCLYAAAASGVPAVDAVFTDFRDIAALEGEAIDAARSGFSAKAAIHPGQVASINAAFTPDETTMNWAQSVVAAFAKSPDAGVVSIDGKMIDMPHLRAARRILDRSGRLESSSATHGRIGTKETS